jgi:hypothetical protein
MSTRLSSRWLLERLALLLLSIGFATAYRLTGVLWPPHSRTAQTPPTTGTGLDRRVAHLHVMDAPLDQVVDSLSRQTRQKIDVDWDKITRDWSDTRRVEVTADLDDVTLETAIQTVFGKVARGDRFAMPLVVESLRYRLGSRRGTLWFVLAASVFH